MKKILFALAIACCLTLGHTARADSIADMAQSLDQNASAAVMPSDSTLVNEKTAQSVVQAAAVSPVTNTVPGDDIPGDCLSCQPPGCGFTGCGVPSLPNNSTPLGN